MGTTFPPGVRVEILDDAPTPRPPSGAAAGFTAGFTEKGPVGVPVLTRGITDWQTVFGARQSDSPAYDAAESFFRAGGGYLWFSRVTGPAPVTASVTLKDSVPADALTVKAASLGAWGNSLNVQVVAGTGAAFVLVITLSGVEVERSPDLADNAAAVAWALGSGYVRCVAVGAVKPAVVAATSLTGGTDDRANATDASWASALDVFDAEIGSGQVFTAGRTSPTAHGQLVAHAAARGRFAVLDAPDSGSVSTVTAARDAVKTQDGARWAAMYGPYLQMTGGGFTAPRTVAPSPVVAGAFAAADAAAGVGQPPAGDYGVLAGFTPTRSWTDAERAQLNDGHVNAIRSSYGVTKIYGVRTIADPATAGNQWGQVGRARTAMAIRWDAQLIGERYVGRRLDGKGQTIGEYGAALAQLLNSRWASGDLYGATAGEAYRVDVGDAVNTPESIAAGELRARLFIRTSPAAEWVVIELVHRDITEEV